MAAALDDAHRPDPRHPGRGPGRPGTGRAGATPRWPMIVLRTPEGLDRPAEVDGLPVEGTWRAHQVPLAEVRTNPEHLRQLEEWLRSYRPEELFDADGRPAAGAAGLRARRRPAAGRHPARQRRRAAARPGPAGLPRLRGRRSTAPGAQHVRADPGAGRHAARRHGAQRAAAQLPRSSARTRPSPTGWTPCSRSPARTGRSASPTST